MTFADALFGHLPYKTALLLHNGNRHQLSEGADFSCSRIRQVGQMLEMEAEQVEQRGDGHSNSNDKESFHTA